MPPIQLVEDDAPGEEAVEETTEPKAEEDTADFSVSAEAGSPQQTEPSIQSPVSQVSRSMPDYGDLIGDDDVKPVVKDSDAGSEAGSIAAASAPKRPEAILISGVERLNRGHIAEVFQAKELPEFVRLDYISDSDVIAVFETPEDASKVLASALEGFRDVPDDGAPGPGLWRARRAMLDFRQATIADEPAFGFKRMHRAGKQVKDYRLWTALKDMDKQILEREDDSAFRKRSAPEDTKEEDEAPRKRPRKDDNTIDMLEKMANQDKKILVKQEEAGILEPLPEAPPPEPEPGLEELLEKFKAAQAAEKERYRDNSKWWGRGSWEHDEREDWEEDGGRWRSQFRQRWNGKGDQRSKGKGKGKGKSKGENATEGERSAADVLGAEIENSEEERKKRARRNERFNAPPNLTKKES